MPRRLNSSSQFEGLSRLVFSGPSVFDHEAIFSTSGLQLGGFVLWGEILFEEGGNLEFA